MSRALGWIGMGAVVCAIAALFLLSGRERESASGKPVVTASIFPIADWLRQIGKDDIEVHCLVVGAADPHHFEPTAADAVRVSRAKAMFSVGLGMDPWARKLSKAAGVKLHQTGSWIEARPFGSQREIGIGGTPVAHGHGDEKPGSDSSAHGAHNHAAHDHAHVHGEFDPHYWLDPRRAATVVHRMCDELSKIDPPNAVKFRQRADAYIEKLQGLADKTDALGKKLHGRQLVTFHDAYGYLFDRLGITIAAVVQQSPGVEPGPRDLADAIEAIQKTRQPVVFREPGSSDRAAASIATQLKLDLRLLDPLDTSSSEAGTSYLQRVEYNLQVLSETLEKADGR